MKTFYQWLNGRDFTIAFIVFMVLFILQFYYPLISSLLNCISSRFQIFESSHPFCANLISSFFIFILSFFARSYFSYRKYKKKKNYNMLKHFEHSYGLVRNEMIPQMEDMVDNNKLQYNNKIDRYIQSPIEYVNETVKGNQVPAFLPDQPYHEAIFDDNIKFIVAITAENPNLWMDPTLCFYMANCYAVSLCRRAHEENNGKYKLVIKDYQKMKSNYEFERVSILDKLSKKQDPDSFQFIRFFLFDKNQNECCKSTVFPSLKATQDLFRTCSCYILKENFQKEYYWNKFKNNVSSIWDSFGDEKMSPVLKYRKENTIPEFLILFYKDNHIEIHTYLDGQHKQIDNKQGSHYFINQEGINIKNVIKDIISHMANYTKAKGDDLENNTDIQNQKNTFIDWE